MINLNFECCDTCTHKDVCKYTDIIKRCKDTLKTLSDIKKYDNTNIPSSLENVELSIHRIESPETRVIEILSTLTEGPFDIKVTCKHLNSIGITYPVYPYRDNNMDITTPVYLGDPMCTSPDSSGRYPRQHSVTVGKGELSTQTPLTYTQGSNLHEAVKDLETKLIEKEN